MYDSICGEMSMTIKKSFMISVLFSSVLISGCSSGNSSNNTVTSVNWQSCADFAESEFQCADVAVPLDYNNLSLGTTFVHAVKYQKYATANEALFINPGGPWGSVTRSKSYFQRFSDSILQKYSIINFDPRGVGLSTKISDCKITSPISSGSTMEQANFIKAFSLYQGQLTACFELESNSVKNYMGTDITAKDMDYIRRGSGYSKISFLGYSYGTQLGSMYLSLFPNNIDKMVLDGNMNPDHDMYPLMVGASGSFVATLQYLLDSCNQNPECVLYPNANEQYFEFVNQIKAGLIHTDDGAVINLDDLYSYLVSHLMRVNSYPLILSDIKDGLNDKTFNYQQQNESTISGNSLVFSIVIGSDLNLNGLSTYQDAMNLASSYWNKTGFDSYVILTNDPQNENLFRSFSSLPNNPLPNLIYPSTVNPVLVVGNYYDPSTNYENSMAMNAAIPNSVLLSFSGGGHCAYNVGVSQCINDHVNAYLLSGDKAVLPPVGTLCNANNPTTLSASSLFEGALIKPF